MRVANMRVNKHVDVLLEQRIEWHVQVYGICGRSAKRLMQNFG